MKKSISFFVLISFIFSCIMPPQGFAQSVSAVGLMPLPGTMATLTPAFTPAHLRGMVIYPNDPFKFDFIVHRGDEPMTSAQKQEEYSKLIKYFLAALAIPDKDQWVNLSPYEKDRIIPDDYGLTEMGRDVLAQDYMLKQISASLTNPDTDLGKKFWEAVYVKSYQKFGTTDIPSDTFNKVWIMPDRAVIFEKGSAVVVLEHHLKVMLESDYSAMKENGLGAGETENDTKAARISKDVMREVILPAIEKEVNEGRNFAPLRQIHNSMLLAAWYKRALKESILNKVYGDKSKVKGIDQDPQANQEIYEKYTAAFRKGAFNMIREDVSRFSQEVIPRKYFSGGDMAMGMVYDNSNTVIKVPDSSTAMEKVADIAAKSDRVPTFFRKAVGLTYIAVLAGLFGGTIHTLWSTVYQMNFKVPATIQLHKGIVLYNPSIVEAIQRQDDDVVLSFSDAKMMLKGLFPGDTLALTELEDPNNQSRGGLLLFALRQKAGHPDKSFLIELIMASLLKKGDPVLNPSEARMRLAALFEGDQATLSKFEKLFVELTNQGLIFLISEKWYVDPSKRKALEYIVVGLLNDALKKYSAALISKQELSFTDAKMILNSEPGLSANTVLEKSTDATTGGIDFAQANLNMQIKRDGQGVPLPVSQQNLDNIHIDGLVPVILNIQPAVGVPLFTEAGGLAASAA